MDETTVHMLLSIAFMFIPVINAIHRKHNSTAAITTAIILTLIAWIMSPLEIKLSTYLALIVWGVCLVWSMTGHAVSDVRLPIDPVVATSRKIAARIIATIGLIIVIAAAIANGPH